jgi:hypothetical protein
MKNLKFIFIFFITLLSVATATAQSGASGNEGTYLNYENYVNSARTSGGDFDIDVNGFLQLGPNAQFEILGAVSNKGTILLDSGAVLAVFGNMLNDGKIIVKKGAEIRFHGKIWKNTTTAKVIDGGTINTTPGGNLVMDTYRPDVTASWLSASPYLSAYSGICLSQNIDGANIPMDVVLQLENPYTIKLINTPTRIEGKVKWGAKNSHIILADNDFIFTKNASQEGFGANNHIVTNGTGHVAKEDYIGKWVFPVGIEGNDYTPAQVENVIANTFNVAVQNYATSASVENTSASKADGVDRTWNIFAAIPTGISSISLQHNTKTNEQDFSESFNFVTRYSNSTPNLTGDMVSTTAWQMNNATASTAGILSSTGTVLGASLNTKSFNNFATKASDSIAYYTKASSSFAAAVVKVLDFAAISHNCESIINFGTGKERNINRIQLQHSTDGNTYSTISTFTPKGDNSTYEYVHLTPISGKNYYRLVLIEPTGDYSVSEVATTIVDCNKDFTPIVLYPNPARENISISGLGASSEINVINMNGRVVSVVSTYVAQIIGANKEVTNIKFVKF